jgi:hypothetical protein
MQAPRCRLVSLGASGPHAIPTLPIQSLFFSKKKIGLILILVVYIIFFLFIKFSFIYF